MNTKRWTALGIYLALMGAAALLLARLGHGQRLGNPGLKLVAQPTYDTNGVVIRTESIPLPAEVLDFASQPINITPALS
ncbi:MAG: hypothetical protein U1G07_21090 [Verrucomicrobiota bacterium]